MLPEDEQTKQIGSETHGLAGGFASAQVIGLQADARRAHMRREAMQYALGARGGAFVTINDIISDARLIEAYLNGDETKPA